MLFKPSKIASDFPVLQRKIKGKRIVYLDSTASSLKPQSVIQETVRYYEECPVNIFRGVYTLSEEATEGYENSRGKVAEFIGCPNSAEVVFTRNATESLNLIAQTVGRTLPAHSNIVSTVMEHHANIVPWQVISGEKKIPLRFIDIDNEGRLKLDDLEKKIDKNTAILTFTFISNVLGTINPVKEIIARVKKINKNTVIVIDAAQAVPHLKLSVMDLGCDFLVFSAHKMLGPTGVGVLWGKAELLKKMPPYQTGGEMIREVQLEKTVYNEPPYKFEAGTPDIAGVLGLAKAVEYLENIGMGKIREHEKELTVYALGKLQKLSAIEIYGPKEATERGGVIAFNLKGIHPHDVAQILNNDNICIRSGHHCAMPLHHRLEINSSCRASFYLYNDERDVDALLQGLENTAKFFQRKWC